MNIEEYEFEDTQILLNAIGQYKGQGLSIYFHDIFYDNNREDGNEVCFDLMKNDVIALAKHFKLTAEDIK